MKKNNKENNVNENKKCYQIFVEPSKENNVNENTKFYQIFVEPSIGNMNPLATPTSFPLYRD